MPKKKKKKKTLEDQLLEKQVDRKQFSLEDKNRIWKYYKEQVSRKSHPAHFALKNCSEYELPCPICYQPMRQSHRLKGKQGFADPYAWNIDHISGDHRNNKQENLQPTHFICNFYKGQVPMTEVLKIRDDYESGWAKLTPEQYQELQDNLNSMKAQVNMMSKRIEQLENKHWWNRLINHKSRNKNSKIKTKELDKDAN